mgnify:CR=1 FL=1
MRAACSQIVCEFEGHQIISKEINRFALNNILIHANPNYPLKQQTQQTQTTQKKTYKTTHTTQVTRNPTKTKKT